MNTNGVHGVLRNTYYLAGIMIFLLIIVGGVYSIVGHMKDKNVHMPIEEKIEIFVSRREITTSLEHLKEDVNELKIEVKNLREAIENNKGVN